MPKLYIRIILLIGNCTTGSVTKVTWTALLSIIIYDKPLGELFTIYCNSQLLATDAQIPFMVYLQAVIIISTSFMGAFKFVNGVDYFVENCKALYYTVNILHGESLIRQETEH